MGSQECGDDIERLLVCEFLVEPKNFQFAGLVEAVAAFVFELSTGG